MDKTIEKVRKLSKEEMTDYSANLMVGGGTPGPCIVSGKGVRIVDDDGKSYIDCTSQSWAMYLGFGNEEIRETVYEHMSELSHVHQGFHTKQRYSLAHRLAGLAPKNLNRVSFTVGGGPAIEAAMKIALKNKPGAKIFCCQWDSYHGSGLTAAGASWVATKAGGSYTGQAQFINDINTNFVRIPNPYCYRCPFNKSVETCGCECAEFSRLIIQKGVIGPLAGIIIEPVQASGGQIPAPKKYLQRIRQIADEFDALLIFDEIQTYIRVGDWYASNHYGVEPDIIVLGKALGAGFPIAAIIIHDRLKGFEMSAEELHTFANNSVSQIAALKQIDIIERDNLLDNTNAMGKRIADKLNGLKKDFPHIGDVRQVGLHIGVELIDLETGQNMEIGLATKIRGAALKNGLVLGTGGINKGLLKFKPSLIINSDEVDEVIDIFGSTLREVLG